MSTTLLRWATYLAPINEPLYRWIADEVTDRLDLGIGFSVGRSYRDLERGAYDIAFVCGLPYVQMSSLFEPVVAPVLAGGRYAGRPVYYSDVVVRRDSPARSFLDLRGQRWAYNEPRSWSGMGVVRYRLARLGVGWDFFGDVVEAGSHENAIAMVLADEVDAAAIDSHVLERVGRDETVRQALRVVDTMGPSAIQPVVVARHLDRGLISELAQVLHGLGGAPMDAAGIQRFTLVDDGEYDDIRAMLAASAAVPIPEVSRVGGSRS